MWGQVISAKDQRLINDGSMMYQRQYTMYQVQKTCTTCSTRSNARARMKMHGFVKCNSESVKGTLFQWRIKSFWLLSQPTRHMWVKAILTTDSKLLSESRLFQMYTLENCQSLVSPASLLIPIANLPNLLFARIILLPLTYVPAYDVLSSLLSKLSASL